MTLHDSRTPTAEELEWNAETGEGGRISDSPNFPASVYEIPPVPAHDHPLQSSRGAGEMRGNAEEGRGNPLIRVGFGLMFGSGSG